MFLFKIFFHYIYFYIPVLEVFYPELSWVVAR